MDYKYKFTRFKVWELNIYITYFFESNYAKLWTAKLARKIGPDLINSTQKAMSYNFIELGLVVKILEFQISDFSFKLDYLKKK